MKMFMRTPKIVLPNGLADGRFRKTSRLAHYKGTKMGTLHAEDSPKRVYMYLHPSEGFLRDGLVEAHPHLRSSSGKTEKLAKNSVRIV